MLAALVGLVVWGFGPGLGAAALTSNEVTDNLLLDTLALGGIES